MKTLKDTGQTQKDIQELTEEASDEGFCFSASNNVSVKNIDPMQKWLPLNHSFVRIQHSLTNLFLILNNLLS